MIADGGMTTQRSGTIGSGRRMHHVFEATAEWG